MKLEDQGKQLADLMSELVPTVDRLAETQKKANVEISETRVSNTRLAEAIEKLVAKIDKIDLFEERFIRIERTLFK
jgi:predicted  nucleic acid-binding Zn-ribbon protein